jgi:hypothetical protein
MQFKKIMLLALASVLVSCGGGRDEGEPGGALRTTDPALFRTLVAAEASIPGKTQITLVSDVGDGIGQGRSYVYTQADAQIGVTVSGSRLSVSVRGDEYWSGDFALPESRRRFNFGGVRDVMRYPLHDPAAGGLQWSGEGRGCEALVGSFRINSSEFDGGRLVSIDMDFVQHCDGKPPALHGNIRWFAGDPTQPSGPAPVPTDAWAPAPGAVPATGSFVYLESDEGDYIGAGGRYLHTLRDSPITVTESGGLIAVSVTGNHRWTGNFKSMDSLAKMRRGLYAHLEGYPGIYNPTRGGIGWSGEGRGCAPTGWFIVDEVTYVDGQMATLDMRFEQRCNGGPWALRGRIRWSVNDGSAPPGPRRIPPLLWSMPADVPVPAGNYVYMRSHNPTFPGPSKAYMYTSEMTVFTTTQNSLVVRVGGWEIVLMPMSSIDRLRQGYYPRLQLFPGNDASEGGISVSGNGSGGCSNASWGWFVIDAIRFDAAGNVMEVDARFWQSCGGYLTPLWGAVHWKRPS